MAAITEYIDAFPLAECKLYLRIDPDQTETDSEVTMMINAASELIESYTQIYLKPQAKTYYFDSNDCVRVYAYPVNASSELPLETKQLYTIYQQTNTAVTTLSTNIGHNDTDNVKSIFKQAVFETVKLWFYGSEDESVIKGFLPNTVMQILSSERRFIF